MPVLAAGLATEKPLLVLWDSQILGGPVILSSGAIRSSGVHKNRSHRGRRRIAPRAATSSGRASGSFRSEGIQVKTPRDRSVRTNRDGWNSSSRNIWPHRLKGAAPVAERRFAVERNY
jgi:hypothetical protein